MWQNTEQFTKMKEIEKHENMGILENINKKNSKKFK